MVVPKEHPWVRLAASPSPREDGSEP
jgi:hypothetical protein